MKILENGLAVLEVDSHISTWVRESGRIDHDLTVQDYIIPMFQPDWHVADVGADIGSHTVRYAERAARVIAFEPNHDQFNCLVWNCRNLPNVTCLPLALGQSTRICKLQKCENAGAGHIGPDGDDVAMIPMDHLPFVRLDFLKLDVEGYELFVLAGARRLIQTYRPIILMEMNAGCLARYGQTYYEVLEALSSLGYEWRSFPTSCDLMNTPQYDLLATPK